MAESSETIPASVVLERTTICRHLNQHELDDLAVMTKRRTLDKGTILFREGEEGDSAVFVARGKLEVSLGKGSQRRILATAEPYQILGELALLVPDKRAATVEAVEPSVVLELTHDKIGELRDVMNSAAFKLIRALSELICARIRDINTRIESEIDNTNQSESTSSVLDDSPRSNASSTHDEEVFDIMKRLYDER